MHWLQLNVSGTGSPKLARSSCCMLLKWSWSISLCFCRCSLLENAWKQDEHGKVGAAVFAVGADPNGSGTRGIVEVVGVRDVLISTGCMIFKDTSLSKSFFT